MNSTETKTATTGSIFRSADTETVALTQSRRFSTRGGDGDCTFLAYLNKLHIEARISVPYRCQLSVPVANI